MIDSITGEILPLPFLRTPYNYSMDQASVDTGLECLDPSLAQQHERDDADINVIMRRFGQGHALPESFRAPQYGDFTGVGDFRSALDAVRQAEASFMSMPPDLRARFHNNPQELLEFLGDVGNRSEAMKLGLIPEPPGQPAVEGGGPAEGGGGTKSPKKTPEGG